MKLERIEDFEVWKRAEAFCVAVNAILQRPGFAKDFNLHDQIKRAIDSILSNMSEGFDQPTDRRSQVICIVQRGRLRRRVRGLVEPQDEVM